METILASAVYVGVDANDRTVQVALCPDGRWLARAKQRTAHGIRWGKWKEDTAVKHPQQIALENQPVKTLSPEESLNYIVWRSKLLNKMEQVAMRVPLYVH